MLTDDLKKKSDELPFKHLIESEEEGVRELLKLDASKRSSEGTLSLLLRTGVRPRSRRSPCEGEEV